MPNKCIILSGMENIHGVLQYTSSHHLASRCLPLLSPPLGPDLSLPPLTTINLVPPLHLPKPLFLDNPRHTGLSLDSFNLRPSDNATPHNLDPTHWLQFLKLRPSGRHGSALGNIDDNLPHARRTRQRGPRNPSNRDRDLDDAQLARAILLVDLGQVAADAEVAVAELVAPVQQIAAAAGGLEAGLAQLVRGE